VTKPKPVTGEVLPPAKTAVTQIDALHALKSMVTATTDYLKIRQEELSKRTEIQAYTELETARIGAAERILHDYFAQVFAERKSNFEELLSRFDEAAKAGDPTAMSQTLSAVVSLAGQSPLAALTDLGELRKVLDDPDHVWQF
jgi:hypothetical protein